ncbi:MAG TPA: PDZ domain-containing protein [Hyphomonadaceae bacterium]|nr:PDZ domain-containing protein [Hyphomonadaceae bacterium]
MKVSRRIVLAGGLAALAAPARGQTGGRQISDALRLNANEYGHAIVPATINDQACLALLDNGLSATLVDLGFAARRSLLSGMTSQVNGGEAKRSVKLQLALGRLKAAMQAPLVDLSDIPAPEEGGVSVAAGRDMLSETIVTLDHDAGVMRMALSDAEFRPPEGARLFVMARVPRFGQAMDVEVEGERMRALVDLGSSFPVMVRESPHVTRWREDGRRWSTMASGTARGGSLTVEAAPVTRVKALRLGPYELAGLPAQVYPANDPVFGGFAAVVGAQVLRQFLASLDVAGGRLWLKPNARFGGGFFESTIGLGTKAEEGGLAVIHISANSPAAAAGFKQDDVITLINGTAAKRSMIGNARPGDVLTFQLATGDIRKVTAALYY